MSLLSTLGVGVLLASAFIVWCGDVKMLIGCLSGIGIVILDILKESEKK